LRDPLDPRGGIPRRPGRRPEPRARTHQGDLHDQAARGARPVRARVHTVRERDHAAGQGRGREGARMIRTLALPAALLGWAKVAFIAYTTFFPMFVAVTASLLRVDVMLLRAAASLGATRRDLLRRVVLPAALPGIVVALRLGFGLAIFVIVGAEFMGADAGL